MSVRTEGTAFGPETHPSDDARSNTDQRFSVTFVYSDELCQLEVNNASEEVA